MERRIKDRYGDRILGEAMARYAVEAGQIELLDGFESFMYAFSRGPTEFILRIGHSLRRSEALILGEVDWINSLARGGVGVARAFPSANGRLVEAIDDGQGGHFLATAFVRARGRPPGAADWNEALFERYGRLIGRMHDLSRSYVPPDPAWRRMEWDDPVMLDAESWLPAAESAILEEYRRLKRAFDRLPKGPESYGLIHQDAHAGNFFVDEQGAITLFDFDDCVYSWYMNDIAIVLFYAALFEEEPAAFTETFMGAFLGGYAAENRLDPAWLEQIPAFLKLREIDLYAVIHRSFDVETVDNAWIRGFMDGRKERIENEVPVVDFDFSSLAGLL